MEVRPEGMNMKKFIFLVCFVMAFAFITTTPTFACITTTGSCSYTFNPVADGYYDGTNFNNNKWLISSNSKTVDNLALLKFDISSKKNIIKTSTITSVKLKVYINSLVNSPDLVARYVANDSWYEGKFDTSHKMSAVTMSSTKISDKQYTDSLGRYLLFDLTSLKLTELKSVDNLISLALQDIQTECKNSKIYLDSKEYCCGKYKPQLIISTKGPCPTPEPSSLILGLMSIGGMLGFRKKVK
jgi:hypothetical protein